LSKSTNKIAHRKIVNSIRQVDQEEWNSVAKSKNIYLSFAYLNALEMAMNNEMDFYYSISYTADNTPVLIAAFQIVRYVDKRAHNGNRFSCIISKAKSRLFTFNVVVCGNVFSDGENGFLFSEKMDKAEAIKELEFVSKAVQDITKKADKKASIVLFKEFWVKDDNFGIHFKRKKFREFMIDVNMVLKLQTNWLNMEDYLSSLKKKYRSRAKSVMRNSETLELKSLTTEEIISNSVRIKELFNNVVEKASFKFGRINVEAFINLKSALGEQFVFRGAFLNNQLVGFSTAICNNHAYEANYVGIDYEVNEDKEIYQRLLYDFIELAIERKASELHLGRTSELIKSAVGAVPENMNLYAKHNNRMHNIALKPIFHFIAPSKFELRQPFKTELSD
jgi:hypothetical protein